VDCGGHLPVFFEAADQQAHQLGAMPNWRTGVKKLVAFANKGVPLRHSYARVARNRTD
jgi:hypothetical protein